MEELIAKIIEQSIVSGGFLFLLWHMVTKQDKTLNNIADVMEKQLEVISEMKTEMSNMNERLTDLERKTD